MWHFINKINSHFNYGFDSLKKILLQQMCINNHSHVITCEWKIRYIIFVIALANTWGFLDPNIWRAKQGRRQDFGSGRMGNIRQNFIHEFLSSPVLQWRRQISVLWGHSAKLYSSKTCWKILKFYKKFAQKLKRFSEIFQK